MAPQLMPASSHPNDATITRQSDDWTAEHRARRRAGAWTRLLCHSIACCDPSCKRGPQCLMAKQALEHALMCNDPANCANPTCPGARKLLVRRLGKQDEVSCDEEKPSQRFLFLGPPNFLACIHPRSRKAKTDSQKRNNIPAQPNILPLPPSLCSIRPGPRTMGCPALRPRSPKPNPQSQGTPLRPDSPPLPPPPLPPRPPRPKTPHRPPRHVPQQQLL